MKVKKEWLIITFDSTTDAMRMETEAKREDIPGRLIPLPTQISAGCGLSWRAEPAAREELEAFMDSHGLRHGSIVVIIA